MASRDSPYLPRYVLKTWSKAGLAPRANLVNIFWKYIIETTFGHRRIPGVWVARLTAQAEQKEAEDLQQQNSLALGTNGANLTPRDSTTPKRCYGMETVTVSRS